MELWKGQLGLLVEYVDGVVYEKHDTDPNLLCFRTLITEY